MAQLFEFPQFGERGWRDWEASVRKATHPSNAVMVDWILRDMKPRALLEQSVLLMDVESQAACEATVGASVKKVGDFFGVAITRLWFEMLRLEMELFRAKNFGSLGKAAPDTKPVKLDHTKPSFGLNSHEPNPARKLYNELPASTGTKVSTRAP